MSTRTESINAITLLTGDMSASVVFYETLGFEVVFGGATEAFTSMTGVRDAAGHQHFVNLQGQPGFRLDDIWGRVIFHTRSIDDVDGLHDAAVAAGFSPEMAPSDAPWGERYFHIRDPSGHELSFACLLG